MRSIPGSKGRKGREPMKWLASLQVIALMAMSGVLWSWAQAEERPRSITLMTFQVGTLRSPRGEAEHAAFQRKIRHLKEVILRGEGGGIGADVVGLQGVEDLVATDALVVAMNRALGPERGSYVTWLLGECGGEEGPRVALLSKFPLAVFRNYFPTPSGPSMLHGVLDVHGVPLHVILNGWHRGPGDDAERMRRRQALWCRRLAETILKEAPHAPVVVMGDFQAPLDSLLMGFLERGASAHGPRLRPISSGALVPWGERTSPSDMDHVFVSKALASDRPAGKGCAGGEKAYVRENSLMPGEHPPAWAECSMDAGSGQVLP